MRKTLILVFALTLILAIPVQASAVTPALRIPHIEIPDISDDVKVELPDDFWDNHFRNNPIKIDYSKVKFDLDIDWGKIFR